MDGLLVLRHAQSDWNATGRWQGHADPELSAEGRRQVDAAAAALAAQDAFEGFDLVVTSDLARARQTAELLVAALDLAVAYRTDKGLREYDIGEWSGHTRREIEAGWPGAMESFAREELAAPPGGETRDAFDARISEAAARTGRFAADKGARRLLVVAHGGVIRSLARSVGAARERVGHLSGYWGRHDERGLFPVEEVDLLGLATFAEVVEAAGEVR